jgi:hypothetical protein
MHLLCPDRRSRNTALFGLLLTFAAALASGPAATFALAADPVWQVEEHWELIIAEPDTGTAGPQISCTISPRGNLTGQYATFDLNHRASPTFAAGGVHLHSWNNENRVSSVSRHGGVLLATRGETITWKTIMTIQSGVLTIDIDDGSSTTWGAFGQSLISSVVTTIPNLDEYSPAISADNSGIGYASNRVTSLKLKKVKYFRASGATSEDNTVRVVHSVE